MNGMEMMELSFPFETNHVNQRGAIVSSKMFSKLLLPLRKPAQSIKESKNLKVGEKQSLKKTPFVFSYMLMACRMGSGYSGTLLLVNKFRVQNGQEPVGLSTVIGTVKRMKPKVDDVIR